ncbi:hypothetical protein HOY80DRAFT_1036864 [Tuber brumale]|nr:hypothetical protein HOY80DRAFT_1036864 [Tuber brumale]
MPPFVTLHRAVSHPGEVRYKVTCLLALSLNLHLRRHHGLPPTREETYPSLQPIKPSRMEATFNLGFFRTNLQPFHALAEFLYTGQLSQERIIRLHIIKGKEELATRTKTRLNAQQEFCY